MALISIRNRRRMKSSLCSSYHSPRLKSSQPAEESSCSWLPSRPTTTAFVVNIALIYCLLGLIGVAGEGDSVAGQRQHSHSSLHSNSEPITLKLLEQFEIYLPDPTMTIGAMTQAASYSSPFDVDGGFESEDSENELNTHKIEDYDSNLSARKLNDSRTHQQRQQQQFRVSEEGADASDEVISINHQSTSLKNYNHNASQSVLSDARNKHESSPTIVPKSFPNLGGAAAAESAIIKGDANSTYSSKDNESTAADDQNRELIRLNNNGTTTTSPQNQSLKEPENNEILDTNPAMPISPSLNCSETKTEWTNDTALLLPRTTSDSESELLRSGDEKLHETALMKSVPISASFASSIKSRRPKRSVVHLYDMVVCSTGCNPLAYKGYGCYCGFLGSGLIVDGIDKCCAKHDWCYHHAKCPPLLTYFVPYYWTCNDGRPKCVNDYRGWKGICGAHLCECDRQFAECLRKYPCPRGRAVCLSSPFRTPVNNYHYNYNYIEDPEIHYYYS